MPTEFPELFAALAAPFLKDEVKKRTHDNAKYITARSAQNRLDQVCGPENWSAEYTPWGEHAVYCRLSITLPNGKVVVKCGIGANTTMSEKSGGKSDPGDDDKAGSSDALKRAAVELGVARYLYRDGVPQFVRDVLRPEKPPADPAPAAPTPAATDGRSREQRADERDQRRREYNERFPTPLPTPQPRPREPGDDDEELAPASSGVGIPETGRALFGWLKGQDDKHHYDVVKHVIGVGKRKDFPPRIVDWDGDQIAFGYRSACAFIVAIRRSADLQETA